jgi:hypothetical protein
MSGVLGVLAQQIAEDPLSRQQVDFWRHPAVAVFGAILFLFNIYCAVRTGMNRRWGLLVLGIFCAIAWWYGAFIDTSGRNMWSPGARRGSYRR